jgi:hypothetical protein
MQARPINGRRQFGKFAVSNGHVGFISTIRCTGVNDKHMIINGNKELHSKQARSCLARDAFARLGRVQSGRGLLARHIPHTGDTVPTRFHIEPKCLKRSDRRPVWIVLHLFSVMALNRDAVLAMRNRG